MKLKITLSIINKTRSFFLIFICAIFSFTALPCLSAQAAPGFDQYSDSTIMKETGAEAMVPISGEYVPDGTYDIEVKTSSDFFKVEKAQLTVKDGKMTALMYMYSYSYSHVYMGSAKDAAAAEEKDYIASEDIDDYSTFTVPVDALDKGIDCAAFSIKKEKWYDRQIIFEASSLPEGTLPFELPDYDLVTDALAEYKENHPEKFSDENGTSSTENTSNGISESETGAPEGMTMDMKDGEYSIETALAGGSGRASVTSPTWFYVKDGKAYAKLLWSSSYYDYMMVDGTKYENETTDGSNSTFTIPVTAMDQPMTVIADTTAMGDPVEIEYTLTFYKDTIGSKSAIPQEGAKTVVTIALIVMIVGAILNHILKTRAKH